MKFWQKIFFGSLIIFIVVFNIAGTFLLYFYHKGQVENEIERGLSEQHSMGSALCANIDFVAYKMGSYRKVTEDILTGTIKEYAEYYGLDDAYIQVYDNELKQIFNNFEIELSVQRQELKSIPYEKRQYIIRDVGDETYLFVTGKIHAGRTELVFVYIKDISKIYLSFSQQTNLFIALSIAVSAFIALVMLMFSLMMTRSISKLNATTQKMAAGNLGERVKIDTKDELGELSVNFNRMADIISEKINELEQKAYEREQFVNYLTHELKTPLTSIIGYANLLRTTDCSEKQKQKALAYLYETSKRLENLSFKLMDILYLNRDINEFKFHDIGDIVESTVIASQKSLEEKNIVLDTDYCEGKLFCDKDLVVTMLSNIVDNAAKASASGQKIRLSVERGECGLVFKVSDSGKGIKASDIQRITQPFNTIPAAEGYKRGSGLGLALCTMIAGLHNAKLEIKSEIGKGTEVTVCFGYNGLS